MAESKNQPGLMQIRLAETFQERLEYCRIFLKVHNYITKVESERIKQDIKDKRGRTCVGRLKEKDEEVTA